MNQFCKTLSEFALEYRTTREKVVQMLEKKATQRERKKTRGKMIVDVSVQFNSNFSTVWLHVYVILLTINDWLNLKRALVANQAGKVLLRLHIYAVLPEPSVQTANLGFRLQLTVNLGFRVAQTSNLGFELSQVVNLGV